MYLVLGKKLSNDHDRAIRYIDQFRATRASVAYSTELTRTDWCDKCNCWHVTGRKIDLIGS